MAEKKSKSAKKTALKKADLPSSSAGGGPSSGGKSGGSSYDASSITVLEGLEAVRRRPGMYIGTTSSAGLHHLVWEVFDNSRDEAMGGFANDIEIALLPENRVRVADNGRGIPVDIHPKTKVSTLETVMTMLHAGGKFGGEGYKVSGGLHGVGVSVVNALSSHVRAEVHRDGGQYMQEYKNGGKPVGKAKKIGTSKLHGTIITYESDATIFPDRELSWETIVSHMRQQAYLVRGLRITILDLRKAEKIKDEEVFYLRELGLDAPSVTFYFEGGLRSLVSFHNRHLEPVHKTVFYVEKEQDDVQVEIALQYVDDITSRISAFANNIYNSEGGMHITGFKSALTRTLNAQIKNGNGAKESETFTGDDVLEGITAVVSVKLREIQFEGQTKSKLGSVEARGAVETVFSEAFGMFLEENPDEARAILGKVSLAMKARKAAKAAKDSILRKGALDGMTLPGKLADCQTRLAEEGELFVVEGDSAGGCFSGDTRVALADGRNATFKDLIAEDARGKKNYCYTIGANGSVAIAPIINPRVTKQDAEVIKVILDSGEEIVCTPDHQFMLRSGAYKQAKDLRADDSLMPLYRRLSKLGGRITIAGYEMVCMPAQNRWIFTHMLADAYNLEQGAYALADGTHRHHKDYNKLNNNPDNIVRVTPEAHLQHHREHLDKTVRTPEVLQKLRMLRKTPEYRAKISRAMSAPKMRAMLSARAKKQWGDPKYREFIRGAFLKFYSENEEYRKRNTALLDGLQKAYWNNNTSRQLQAKRVRTFFANHPERRAELSALAKAQWNNNALKKWRSGKTKEQWTDTFRAKRKITYNKTYRNKALKTLRRIFETHDAVIRDAYNKVRKETNDKTLLRFDTIVNRFFGRDEKRLIEAVKHYNHKVARIKSISEKIDVYDLEVPETHNFALAGGVFVHNSAKMGRDRRIQAILPLRGKILNIERARIDKMLASEQIKNLVVALGTAIGDVFNIEKLRYHKIIIATDADVDGAHIRTLLLTLFYRHFKPLIEGGYIYIAQPPLFKIKKGKEIHYAYSDEERVKLVGKHVPLETEIAEVAEEEPAESEAPMPEGVGVPTSDKGRSVGKAKLSIQRYKGLGEMNSEELWETTMDPARRILKLITIEDAEEADMVFDMLMGTDVPARKSFIQSHAKEATLDI